MGIQGVISIAVVTVFVFVAVMGIGILVQRVPTRIVRFVNWIAFALAVVSGLATYNTANELYRYLFLAGLIAYFLTIKYKTE